MNLTEIKREYDRLTNLRKHISRLAENFRNFENLEALLEKELSIVSADRGYYINNLVQTQKKELRNFINCRDTNKKNFYKDFVSAFNYAVSREITRVFSKLNGYT